MNALVEEVGSGLASAKFVDELARDIALGAPPRLRSILDHLPAAVYTTDAAGVITYFNRAAVAFAGREPVIGTDKWCISLRLYRPDGAPMRHDECPLACALRDDGSSVSGVEAIAERPDGTRVAFEAYPSLLRNEAGEVIGAINMLVDVSSRKLGEEAAHRLAAIVESSDDAIVSKTLDGKITSWNKGAERVFGYLAEEAIGQPVTMLIPASHLSEEASIIDRIKRGERVEHYETVRQKRDGTLIDVSLTVSPVRDKRGRVIGASKIARDISDRKRREAQVTMLAREAEHRTKNVLATVQAAVQLSEANDVEGLKSAISGRIQALANVHALFVQSRWTGADLATLIQQEITPYSPPHELRATIEGPHILLEPNTAQTLAVTLHELTTNAAKYGALSAENGRVEVSWRRGRGSALRLRWSETGGPPILSPPVRKGFGMRVIEAMIQSHPGGDVRLDWRADGLVCDITAPI